MTTLVARANQAWIEYADQNGFHPHSAERQIFEESWETGYKTAVDELHPPTIEEVEKAAHALYADNEVGAWEDGNLDTLLQYRRTARVVLESYTGCEVQS